MASIHVGNFSSTTNIVEKEPYSSTISIELKNLEVNPTEKGDYDPLKNRIVKHPVSDIRSTANLLKASLGTGILAVPVAFKNSGYIVGIIGTVLMGYLCAHAAHIFVKTSRRACAVLKVPSLGYAETCEAVFETGPKRLRRFSSFVKLFTDWSMALTYIGACSVYIVLISVQLKDIVTGFYPDFEVARQLYTVVFLIPLIFLVQIKNLKFLAPFSALANILMFAVFAICLYYILNDFPGLTKNIQPTNDISKLPLFMTTIIFAMEGIGVVMPVENEMKKPQHFLGYAGILCGSMSFIVVMYLVLGLLGYMKYGDDVLGSITLNLPNDAIPAILGKILIIVAIFLTFLLQFYVPMEVIWRYTKKSVDPKRHTIVQIAIRLSCLFIIVALALLLPKIEQIISLVGAIFYSSLGVMFPATIETIFEWDRDLGLCKWKLWKNALIILVGLVTLIFGSLESIKAIFE